MLPADVRIRPNTTDVAAKVIDGEAIILNLANGMYFSMDQVGAEIWELAERSFSIEEIVSRLVGRFEVSRETAEEDVKRLVSELIEESLVTVTEASGPSEDAPPDEAGALAYTSPVLNKYSDMADILALDPPMPGLGIDSWE